MERAGHDDRAGGEHRANPQTDRDFGDGSDPAIQQKDAQQSDPDNDERAFEGETIEPLGSRDSWNDCVEQAGDG